MLSQQNLNLAWRRLATTKDARYKSYFRHIMEAYELSHKENILDLYYRIKNNDYEPRSPIRIYYPKSSGLQRPITLLNIEDQIVLQAITNIFADKVRDRRKLLIGKSIFSNWLTKKRDSDFFLSDWKYGYHALRNSLLDWYRRGYNWTINFDLSAFYDTIPHDLLIKTISPRGGNQGFSNFIANCLKVWTADTQADRHSHGIPQGPNASAFLAECIMLSIDEKMHESCVYLRYVDDIRILGQSEYEVRRALVNLDILCRERGLIPNSEKTNIIKVKNEDQLIENIPPILFYEETFDQKQKKAEAAGKELLGTLSSNNDELQVIDKSKFRYILFRAGPSNEILEIVKKAWSHFPQHIDAFSSFLENYNRIDDVVNICMKEIKSSPYDFIRGECWKILTRMCNVKEIYQLKDFAIQAIRSKNGSATKIGAYQFLLRCEELGIGSYSDWLIYEDSSLIQAIAIQNFHLSEDTGVNLAIQILQRRSPDPSLAMLVPLFQSKLTLQQLSQNPSKLLPVTLNVYSKVGLIGKSRRINRDVLGIILHKRYKIPLWNKWHILFGNEYSHAYSLLQLSESHFTVSRSSWLAQQDAFNDALFRAFQKFIMSKNSPGAIPIIDNKGVLLDYGALIRNQVFSSFFPNLAHNLVISHRRRSSLPNAHPYEKYTGNKATALKLYEQRKIVAHLRSAYIEIINIATGLGI